jgi:hypothetical protein
MIQRFVAVLLLAGCCLAQNPDRKEVTVSPEILANYVGVYAIAPRVNMTITLPDGRLISQVTGQGTVALAAELETMFFPKGIDAEIEFPKDQKGPAGQLILHQNGRDMTAKRLDEAAAKRAADAAAAFDKRFKDQTAAPGSEAAVRRMIGELRAGKPNYDLMSPGLANLTRQQLPQIQSMMTEKGAFSVLMRRDVLEGLPANVAPGYIRAVPVTGKLCPLRNWGNTAQLHGGSSRVGVVAYPHAGARSCSYQDCANEGE